ncbi:MAG: diaminopimelate epimerase [Prevotellaceae bacterium]|jgi:diaminopimelate epimerase|nr:diaminopimelate epimerase [Prevotellaceae bacterium]
MTKLPFIKMHGAGNDYVFVDCLTNMIENPSEFAVNISDRHFGVGSDGLVLILPSQIADCRMQMFNSDGSQGRMCGNAIRCVGKYFYENYLQQDVLKIETLSGIRTLEIFARNNIVTEVRVDMGFANFSSKNIPIDTKSATCINLPLEIEDKIYHITAVSMGNPHCVVFCRNVDEVPLATIGTKFEHHSIFPENVNTEFVQIIDSQTIKMRVWERGSGETLACGTGACAAIAAAVKNGLLKPNTEVCVCLKGGKLYVRCNDDYQIFMKGDAVEVFRGEF